MARKTRKDPALFKKEFLARLAQGYGITEACKQIRLARSTCSLWRKKDAGFEAEVQRILSDPIHTARLLRHEGETQAATFSTWQRKFIALYRQTGSRDEAIAGCGKDALEVAAALDSSHEDYDSEFARLFKEEETRRLWRIEDNLLKKAEHDTPASKFVLQNLASERFGKAPTPQGNQFNFWFTQSGEEQAKDTLAGLFGNRETQQIEAQSRSIATPASEPI